MKGPLVWLGACVALLLGGVGWISVTALRLERAEARARRQAAVEEHARLALWRLDSEVAPILQRESSHPPADYVRPGEASEPIRARFQIDADRELRASDPALAARLAELPLAATAPWGQAVASRSGEYQARSKVVQQAANAAVPDQRVDLREEAMRPTWVGGELFLLRRVRVDGALVVQGCWLDWPALRRTLLRDVADLFPRAALEAARPGDTGERLLASLPVRLVAGDVAAVPAAAGAPVRLILAGAWGAVLLAAAALVVLLVGTLALSERRAAFVSAVTHELRTPLTTVRTYTEMLADDMVVPEKRPVYLATLAREATRLSHLVDNVLVYARLERGRKPTRSEPLDACALLEGMRARLEERAAGAGMSVAIDAPAGLGLRGDPVAVEQILFNLVDNSCKYAAQAEDKRVRISAAAEGEKVVLRVVDAGAGIASTDRRWLFAPFARSAERAAGSAPGVGLGLALCRRLARAMGGDLVLEDGPGARFALRLRKA